MDPTEGSRRTKRDSLQKKLFVNGQLSCSFARAAAPACCLYADETCNALDYPRRLIRADR